MAKQAAAVPILMYHHVSPSPGLVTVAPETFRAQMAWLAREGYEGISCDRLARFMAGEALPDKSVLITFDDGYLDNWVHAAPILAEFGLHAVLFLITGHIGDGATRSQAGAAGAPACPSHRDCMARVAGGDTDSVMLRWSEVEAMRRQGVFEFHSHTHSHTRWDQRESDLVVRQGFLDADLATSRDTLVARLGSASEHLCWPQGYFDEAYLRSARAAGFKYLYTVEKGVGTRRTNPERIPRIVVKDRVGAWFARRLWLYRRPFLSGLYLRLRGD